MTLPSSSKCREQSNSSGRRATGNRLGALQNWRNAVSMLSKDFGVPLPIVHASWYDGPLPQEWSASLHQHIGVFWRTGLQGGSRYLTPVLVTGRERV